MYFSKASSSFSLFRFSDECRCHRKRSVRLSFPLVVVVMDLSASVEIVSIVDDKDEVVEQDPFN